MKLRELFHDTLRLRGIPKEVILDADEQTDAQQPLGAALMEEDIPESMIPFFRKIMESRLSMLDASGRN